MKRLSALAQLVALYAEKGITSAKQLCELTGFCERHIRRAMADSCVMTHTSERTHTSGHMSPPERGSSPLKKKGLPRTPSKEKTNPPPPVSKRKEEEVGTAKRILGEESQHWIGKLGRVLKLDARAAENFLDGQIEMRNWPAVKAIYTELRTRIDAGEKYACDTPTKCWGYIARDFEAGRKTTARSRLDELMGDCGPSLW